MFRALREPDVLSEILREVPDVGSSLLLGLWRLSEAEGSEGIFVYIAMSHMSLTRAPTYLIESSSHGVSVRAKGDRLTVAPIPPHPRRGTRVIGPSVEVSTEEFASAVLRLLPGGR
jgi:hypothetical protein